MIICLLWLRLLVLGHLDFIVVVGAWCWCFIWVLFLAWLLLVWTKGSYDGFLLYFCFLLGMLLFF